MTNNKNSFNNIRFENILVKVFEAKPQKAWAKYHLPNHYLPTMGNSLDL